MEIPNDQLKALLDCCAEVASQTDAIRVAGGATIDSAIHMAHTHKAARGVDDGDEEIGGLTEM